MRKYKDPDLYILRLKIMISRLQNEILKNHNELSEIKAAILNVKKQPDPSSIKKLLSYARN